MAKAVAIATVTIDAQAEIPDQLTVDRVTSLVTFALESENLEGEWEFALAFVDLRTMIQMHVNFMDDDDPTDILTFPFGPDMGPGGDIAICVPVANTNAHEYGSDLETELQFLILHGVLHVIGHDDATVTSRQAMLARQQAILDAWSARFH